MPTPESASDDAIPRNPKPRRRGRRVTWTPEGNPGDGSDTVPTSETDAAWGDSEAAGRDHSNDDRLTTDKPPHWG